MSENKDYQPEVSKHTGEYRKTVKSISKSDDCSFEQIIIRLVSGNCDESDKERFISQYLDMVINMASHYSSKGVAVDELISEGNLSLVVTVNNLKNGILDISNSNNIIKNCDELVRNNIRNSLIEMIDEQYKNEGDLNYALAKANLVYEAANVLAEELCKVPDVNELSEYTHIPVEEIEEIIRFAGDVLPISDSEKI